jgi:hypothetical protein
VSKIPFICPNCGGDTFRVSAQQKTLNTMIGAPCAGCGTPLTEEEIKKQARKIAQDAAKKAFKKVSKTIKLNF